MKGKMKKKDFLNKFLLISSIQDPLNKIPASILGICLLIASFVWFLPHLHMEGNLVPALEIFTEHTDLFHALIISLILSFSGASGALLIRNFSRHATAWRCYFRISLVSMASALLILACTVFLEIFRLVSSGSDFWVVQVFRKICSAFSEITRSHVTM